MTDVLKGILDVALKVIGFLSVPVLVVSIILMIKNLKRYYPVQPKGLALQTLSPIVVFIIYALVLSLDPPKVASGMLLAVGLGLGVLTSQTTRLGLSGGLVFGQRSVWYLVAWAATFSLTQLLALFARSEYAAWGFSTLYFSLGLTLGTTGTLFVRRQRILSGDEVPSDLRSQKLPAAPEVAAVRPCPNCGEPAPAGSHFCTRCGLRLAL